MQKLDLLTCSIERLKLAVPMMKESTLLEARRKIRATFKAYAKEIEAQGKTEELVRKDTVFYNEIRARMKKAGFNKYDTHWQQEKLVGHNPHEQALKINGRR